MAIVPAGTPFLAALSCPPVAVVGAGVAIVAGVTLAGVGLYYLLRDKYGDIMEVETSGASRETAKWNYQKGKAREGVKASHQMAEEDAESMSKYHKKIKEVADEYDIDPALIAGIISRESRAGVDLDEGWGDHRRAWGLMQVDKRWHKPKGDWDSKKHLSQATGILVDLIETMQKKKAFSGLSKEKQLKGGIAAYNMGDKNVHSYARVDENTTGGDYSNDVVARAQWYKKNPKKWMKG